jgi:hypothetical protein
VGRPAAVSVPKDTVLLSCGRRPVCGIKVLSTASVATADEVIE